MTPMVTVSRLLPPQGDASDVGERNSAMATDQDLDDDARGLAELGYAQELRRGMSAFSNFAISFSIISILAGCTASR